ncbi:MAG: dockerin type I repeat-containing protein [Phycisphaerales bacterium]|jgi:hypothetical protein|nr:dockerin type I repeat-containing protein [Phycisphaerales bacterium]
MPIPQEKISAILASGFLCASVFAGPVQDNHGLTDLIARLGDGNEPTGAGIEVAQVEATQTNGYAPDVDHAEFAGKTFTFVSGTSGVSNHATNVGKRMYGTGNSGIAPGTDTIYLYAAIGWAQADFLKVGTGSNPSSPPGNVAIFNNSWIGSFGSTPLDTETLCRADWSVDTSNAMMLCGVANTGAHQPLLSFGFNGVSVGTTDGSHLGGQVPSGYASSGMQIPLIVAEQGTTSNATGVVSGITAMIVETAETHPNTSGDYFATMSETTKAVLLAGGNHEADWTNNPETTGPDRGRTDQPIDAMVGVGTANIDRSWQVMAGGKHNSSTSTGGLTPAPYAGWETSTITNNQSRYILFDVNTPADEVSIVLTWHQTPRNDFSSYIEVDLDLQLWKFEGGSLVSLTGDAGLGVFSEGNVVSESLVDTVEHLYIQDLAIGEYVLEVTRKNSSASSRAFSVGWLFPEPADLPGDINGDGILDVEDLLMILSAWGLCSGCEEDLTGDGTVDVTDLLQFLSYW